MSLLEVKFNFNPIGQGCFYTGKLMMFSDDKSSFNFVYDCGTYSRMLHLQKEIHNFKKSLTKKILDLLIISHFDADHVNGVVELLLDIQCKKLVIPYYDPIERLLLLATTTSIDPDYRLMLVNPIDFFSSARFQIDEIILVGGPNDDENQEGEESIPVPPSEKKYFKNVNKESVFEIKKDTLDGAEREDEIGKINREEGKSKNYPKLQFLRKPYRITNEIWEFVFYLKQHNNSILLEKFTSDVDSLISKKSIQIFDIFEEDNINEIKRFYRKYYGENLNNTSLVTYHGPLVKLDPRGIQHLWIESCSILGLNEPLIFGSLLTGDINISSKLSKSKLLDYFKHYINEVCVFQVPHHGSLNNWPLKDPSGLLEFNCYIINHGLGRKNHPSTKLIEFILKNCTKGKLHLNNEVAFFATEAHFYF